MATPPDTTEAPPPPEGEGQDGVEVCLFDESPERFSRAVRAISELASGEPEPGFPDAEVERLASSIMFLREWSLFSYEPKGVSFTYGAESASSRDDTHKITLPKFSSASVPQIMHPEGGRDNIDSQFTQKLKLMRKDGQFTYTSTVPVTGRSFIGTKTQGVSTYQLSDYLIWSFHASEITGYAAYYVADGTAVRFQLTPRFWEKEPRRNHVPYFLCGSLSEEKTVIKIGVMLQNSPLSKVPLVPKQGTKIMQDVDQVHNIEKERLPLTDSGYNCTVNPELIAGQQDGPDEGQETGAIVLAGPTMQQNAAIYNSSDGKSPLPKL